ncbi:MAG: preprotein translocase subunit Sec61beta [Candidatus Jordarchaeaceae archaeon]
MSRIKRRRTSEGPMPIAGAGLIRFFEEETAGPKIGPAIVVVMCVALIVVVIIALYLNALQSGANIPGLPKLT